MRGTWGMAVAVCSSRLAVCLHLPTRYSAESLMRKRRASLAAIVARRAALGILLVGPLWLPPGILPASELPPVLRVAEQSPELADVAPQATSAEPATERGAADRQAAGEPAPSSATEAWRAHAAKTRLASGATGWIAREAIGQQVPLTDPVVKPVSPEDAAAETANPAGPSGTTEASEPSGKTEPSGTTEPSGKTEPSGTTAERRTADEVTSGTSAAPRSAAAAEIALTAPAAEEVRGEEVVPEGTLSLEALSPVPLMELDAPASSTEVTERSPAAAAVPLPAEHAAAEREAEAEMSGSAEPPAAA